MKKTQSKINKLTEKLLSVVNHPSDKVRYSGYFALIMILSIFVYFFTATMSILTRGHVSQSYWYCAWDMGRDVKEGVKCPHHYGYKPAMPLIDHVCGDKELRLAKESGCDL